MYKQLGKIIFMIGLIFSMISYNSEAQDQHEDSGHLSGIHVNATAEKIVYQALPAPAVFRSQVPEAMQADSRRIQRRLGTGCKK